jgi:hypothetical protein
MKGKSVVTAPIIKGNLGAKWVLFLMKEQTWRVGVGVFGV